MKAVVVCIPLFLITLHSTGGVVVDEMLAMNPENQLLLPVADGAAKRLGIAMQTYTIAEPEELEGTIAAAKAAGAEAIMTPARAVLFLQAQTHRRPRAEAKVAARDERSSCRRCRGAASSVPGCAARSATYVDRILKGAKPGDLAVERYGGKQLVIHLKTAKALGMNVDASALQGAKIIE